MTFRNIIVTGANRGIGLEFIRQLVGLSPPASNIIATTRSDCSELNKLVASNNNLHVLKYDGTKFDAYDAFVNDVHKIVGKDGIDLLVNNAGVYIKGDLDTIDADKMMDNFKVNTVAPLMLTKTLLPLLKEAAKQRRTVVANISSQLGSIGDNGPRLSYCYRTSKAALNMVSHSLAVDLKGDNIIVVALCPGWVRTDMGGPNAAISPTQCVSSLLRLINSLDSSKSGTFLNSSGSPIPW